MYIVFFAFYILFLAFAILRITMPPFLLFLFIGVMVAFYLWCVYKDKFNKW